MSCCNNPTNSQRSAGDIMMSKQYCPLVQSVDTSLLRTNYSLRENFCSSCQTGLMEVMQSGYSTLGSAYTRNQFPRPTGGSSCIQMK